VRSISATLTADLSDTDLVERLLQQAEVELDAAASEQSGTQLRTPEEHDALRRALEALARALSVPPVERYRFASRSHSGVEYEITIDGADVFCTCPGFEYRGQCRHAREVKEAVAMGSKLPAGYRSSHP
jgi:hypothetical protein